MSNKDNIIRLDRFRLEDRLLREIARRLKARPKTLTDLFREIYSDPPKDPPCK